MSLEGAIVDAREFLASIVERLNVASIMAGASGHTTRAKKLAHDEVNAELHAEALRAAWVDSQGAPAKAISVGASISNPPGEFLVIDPVASDPPRRETVTVMRGSISMQVTTSTPGPEIAALFAIAEALGLPTDEVLMPESLAAEVTAKITAAPSVESLAPARNMVEIAKVCEALGIDATNTREVNGEEIEFAIDSITLIRMCREKLEDAEGWRKSAKAAANDSVTLSAIKQVLAEAGR